ncbi:hypothetical protein CTAYLR_008951 [Chrysophaeum taylorii]|uniref:Uncharacterized protein n=1 Tax=Chrysophaeum taylorii TaxID=2483200 RepID=A0AAD7XR94_9STRA|nr:hypothetical protein CTAYLR_008951 [Chrysophaeum taylorii]
MYSHCDGRGVWHPYSASENEAIAAAERAGASSVPLNVNGVGRFEVRFGSAAVSRRMAQPPSTGMIQVNVENESTRVVRKEVERSSRRPSSRNPPQFSSMTITDPYDNFAADSEPLFGWLLRKQSKGWRKGSWQRRFFVLAPRSSALFYFTKGLHSRHVDLIRKADPSAPQAKGSIHLAGAVIDARPVDEDKPYSFTVRVPGAEYYISARADYLKDKWLAQLHAVARGEPLGGPPPTPTQRPQAASYRLPPTVDNGTPVTAPNTWGGPTAPPPPFGGGGGGGGGGLARIASQPEQEDDYDGAATPAVIPEQPPPAPALKEEEEEKDESPAYAATAPVDEEEEWQRPVVPEAARRADEDGDLLSEETIVSTPPPPSRPPPPPPPEASSEDVVDKFTSLVTGGDAAEEHSECAVCFDELHARPVGVLTTDAGRRLCRHLVHLDCLRALPGQPSPACPMCRRASTGTKELPRVVDDPRAWFDLLDVDGEGRIEAEDVLATLKSQLAVREEELEANWDKIWDRFDLDHSGSLSYDELVDPDRGLLAVIKQLSPSLDEDLEATSAPRVEDRHAAAPDLTKDKEGWFEYWDDDGSGSLDEGELVRALVHSFDKRGRREEVRAITEIVHALLAACDVEGDGLISRDEFLAPNAGLADVIIGNFGFFADGGEEPAAPPAAPAAAPSPPAYNDVHAASAPPSGPPVRRRDDDFAIEIRTNGGNRYTAADLDATPRTTVGTLRGTAARLHNNMDPSRVRLVNRGQQLRDDNLALSAAGVRDGDSLVLVVGASSRPTSDLPPARPPPRHDPHASWAPSSSSSSFSGRLPASLTAPPVAAEPPSAATPPPYAPPEERVPVSTPPITRPQSYYAPQQQPQYHQCRVTVPSNAGPGAMLTIRAPTGQTLRVSVPPGQVAGSSFTVQYDPNARQSQRAPSHPVLPNLPPQPQPSNMRVQVPPGVTPGSVLTVNVPNVGHCRVTVPLNVYPGQYFEFRVPAPPRR